MPVHLLVRHETEADLLPIRALVSNAFGRTAEADLVERLRADGDIAASMVGERDGRVVAHVLFAPVVIDIGGGEELHGVSMGPVSVAPDMQGRGLGARIVDRGIATTRALGYSVALVLGYPDYYSRLGFSAQLARQLNGPYDGEAFMAMELMPGALAGVSGSVRYPAAFQALA